MAVTLSFSSLADGLSDLSGMDTTHCVKVTAQEAGTIVVTSRIGGAGLRVYLAGTDGGAPSGDREDVPGNAGQGPFALNAGESIYVAGDTVGGAADAGSVRLLRRQLAQ